MAEISTNIILDGITLALRVRFSRQSYRIKRSKAGASATCFYCAFG